MPDGRVWVGIKLTNLGIEKFFETMKDVVSTRHLSDSTLSEDDKAFIVALSKFESGADFKRKNFSDSVDLENIVKGVQSVFHSDPKFESNGTKEITKGVLGQHKKKAMKTVVPDVGLMAILPLVNVASAETHNESVKQMTPVMRHASPSFDFRPVTDDRLDMKKNVAVREAGCISPWLDGLIKEDPPVGEVHLVPCFSILIVDLCHVMKLFA